MFAAVRKAQINLLFANLESLRVRQNSCLLRMRRNWPCRRRATEKGDELAASHVRSHTSEGHRSRSNRDSERAWQCPLWVKSGHVQCTRRCPLSAKSIHWREMIIRRRHST
jgi:hypothetical protein